MSRITVEQTHSGLVVYVDGQPAARVAACVQRDDKGALVGPLDNARKVVEFVRGLALFDAEAVIGRIVQHPWAEPAAPKKT